MKDNIEDIKITVDPEENKDQNILKVNASVKFKKPLETVTLDINKPEGMSDEQFEVFIKHLKKEIEEQNIHAGELTS